MRFLLKMELWTSFFTIKESIWNIVKKSQITFLVNEDLALSRRQCRQLRTIQHWKSEMKEFRNVTSFVQVKDFHKLGIHSDSGKRKRRGMYCNKDKRYIVCLSCKVFVCHKTCLIPLTKNLLWKHQILNLTIGHVPIIVWSNEVFNLDKFMKNE